MNEACILPRLNSWFQAIIVRRAIFQYKQCGNDERGGQSVSQSVSHNILYHIPAIYAILTPISVTYAAPLVGAVGKQSIEKLMSEWDPLRP